MMTDTDHAREQAESQLEHIRQLVQWLDHANSECLCECELEDDAPVLDNLGIDYRTYHDEDAAQQAINEHPLEIAVRSRWHAPGDAPGGNAEFYILLSTGGPACRIVGELDDYNQPETARIEYQDWFTPWTEYPFAPDAEADLLRYCQQFYFES